MKIISVCLGFCFLGLVFTADTWAQDSNNNYPGDVVNNFIDSCTKSAVEGGVEASTAKNICVCSFQQIQNQYTYEEFVEIDRQAAQGQPLPNSFNQIVDECVSQYSN